MTIFLRLITIALALWATQSFAEPHAVASMQWSLIRTIDAMPMRRAGQR